MTTILGIQGEGFAVLCTDSRISLFEEGGTVSRVTTLGTNSSKVCQNGKYLIGAAGDVRAINILQHVFNPPAPPTTTKGKRLDGFITKTFIPALRQCFEEQGFFIAEGNSQNHPAQHSATIIVAVHGVIYVIEGDYSWTVDASGVYAIGTGSGYALGALSALVNTKKVTPQQAKTFGLKALQIASRFDPYTGTPFQTYIQDK
jgi:ATP-dependent protease HslVU (ClpYQ) peptidase subunit